MCGPSRTAAQGLLAQGFGRDRQSIEKPLPSEAQFPGQRSPLDRFWLGRSRSVSLTLSFESSLSSPPSYPVRDDVEGRNEELVADEGEGVEHVEDADGVQHDGAVLPLLLREQVRREEGVVPAAVALGGKLDAAEKEGRE